MYHLSINGMVVATATTPFTKPEPHMWESVEHNTRYLDIDGTGVVTEITEPIQEAPNVLG